jgi:hypothetical protein
MKKTITVSCDLCFTFVAEPRMSLNGSVPRLQLCSIKFQQGGHPTRDATCGSGQFVTTLAKGLALGSMQGQ